MWHRPRRKCVSPRLLRRSTSHHPFRQSMCRRRLRRSMCRSLNRRFTLRPQRRIRNRRLVPTPRLVPAAIHPVAPRAAAVTPASRRATKAASGGRQSGIARLAAGRTPFFAACGRLAGI